MKKNTNIRNIQDLQAEILRLKALSKAQESYLGDQYVLLKKKVQTPARVINNITSFLPGSSVVKSFFSAKTTSVNSQDGDWLSKGLKIGTLAAIDRLFLRRAGFIKRLLIGLLSQQAVNKINKNTASDIIGKITDWIKPKSKKAPVPTKLPNQSGVDYGIPPDSETY